PDRLEVLADRTDGTGDEDRLARDLTGLACQLDGSEVDVAHLTVEAVTGKLDPVGPEGVGLDQLGPGRDVRSVNFLDDLGLGEIELVEGALEADAAGVQLGAHGAIAQEGAAAKPFEERVAAVFGGHEAQ